MAPLYPTFCASASFGNDKLPFYGYHEWLVFLTACQGGWERPLCCFQTSKMPGDSMLLKPFARCFQTCTVHQMPLVLPTANLYQRCSETCRGAESGVELAAQQ
mmetsp:Transcript_43937/g.75902  ORF Transcript_43937/g.75902 Transcript_43937/m.75902 type:complete len:103 (-) Transcript_43937:303-611(-)